MNPRLSNSKTWTNFPPEFLEQVQDLVAETFEENLIEGAGLHLDGRIYPEEILFRLGIRTEGSLKQDNFEISAHYNPEAQNAKKVMHHCIEAAASMMAEYFDFDGEADFPRQWTEFKFEGTPLFVQYTTVNTDLEAEADRLLGSLDSELVHEQESQDALDYVVEERIQVSPEDDEADDLDDLNFEGDDGTEEDEDSGHCQNYDSNTVKH
ncbi:MAG: hypothetical protein RJB66_2675 [Pseudomonadota bacterium]